MLSHPGNLSVDTHMCRRHGACSRLLALPPLFTEFPVMVRPSVGVLLAALIFAGVGVPSDEVSAADPLNVRVDRLVTESPLGLVSGSSSDGEFLRRMYLVVVGRIPSIGEIRAFLDDKSPTKRTTVVDRLLGTRAYVRRMTNVLDVMLSERRGDGEVKRGEWEAFLKKSIETNKPWNVLASEILGADAVDAKQRGPAKFLMDRSVEVNQMTREVGRMFFGVDLQCAQCHNHPLIDDYLQKDYYGIYAFLNRTYLFKPDKKKPGVLAERPSGGVAFKSVFTGDAGVSRPRLLGERQLDEPTIEAGKEYKVKPDKKKKNLRPVPTYNRRERLAKQVLDGKNRFFARNMANRLWALVMGRGLVEPLDLHHSDNPPSHPELLELLTDEFIATKYDVRGFLRELVLSRTFARGSVLPADLVARSASAGQLLGSVVEADKTLVAELASADKRVEVAVAAELKVSEPVTALAKTLKPANDKVAAEKKKHDPAAKALADATNLSRERIKGLIADGQVTVGGKQATSPSAKVEAGTPFTIALPAPVPLEAEPQDIPLVIAYEDAHLIVVDKPAGMVVHPAAGNRDGTLVNALLHHCSGQLSGINGVERPGIVHRLDKDTSGLMVAAKTNGAHAALSRQFASHTMERAYLAVVRGVPNPQQGEISGNIGRNPKNRKKMAVVPRGGRSALTRYRLIRTLGKSNAPVASLVECRLATGRTHQIRVHLSHRRHDLPEHQRRCLGQGHGVFVPAGVAVQDEGIVVADAVVALFHLPYGLLDLSPAERFDVWIHVDV